MLKNKTALSLSPLALLTLAACGGTSGAGSKAVIAEKGPLNLATAFLDYNDDGTWQELLEPGALTDATGAASFSLALTPTNAQATAGYDLKIVGGANTIDMSSNTVFSDSLSAPSTSTMITPVTTIMAESSLTKEQVVATLGLPAGMDPLTFSSFDTTLTDAEKTTALAVEKAAQKVMSIVSTFATAAESSGASSAMAFKVAMTAVVESVKDATTAYEAAVTASTTPVVLAFTDAQVDAVKLEMDTQITAAIAGTDGYTAGDMTTAMESVFDTQVSNNVIALKKVVGKIEAITSSDLSASKDIFALTSSLVDQVKTATDAIKTAQDDGNALVLQAIAFTSDAAITASIANPGPTDMALSSATIAEDATSLVIGTVTTTDTSDAGTAAVAAVGSTPAVPAVPATVETGHTYSIVTVAGTDGAKFSIDAATGVLTLLEQPDYETKTSYTVAIKTTEAGANPKSYTETFTIAVTDAVESGAFGISSDTVKWTDYNPAVLAVGPSAGTAASDVSHSVMTSTTGSQVSVGANGFAGSLNLQNLKNLLDDDVNTIGKSPNLDFTLDTVPTGTGTGTIKATIIQGNDATRSGTESEISVTVTVGYKGDGTTATLTMPAAGTGAVSYTRADDTTASYTVTNVDADAFSITAANATTGDAAVLSVKMGALYDVFVNSAAGASDMLRAGNYSIALETTLPLQNYANETVTKFTGFLEIEDQNTKDSIIGTDGADTITGTSAGEIIFAGAGKDTISTGTGVDYIILSPSVGGSATLANADTVSDFTNGTDKFALAGVTHAELTVKADASNAADTVISVTATSSAAEVYLMTVTGVAYGNIQSDDFVLVDDIV